MLKGVEQVLIKERPKLTLVCSDANTNLAAALAARKLQIQLGHVESGVRSYDWRMPEEHNRRMIDHISEYLFVPTDAAKDILLAENVRGRIYVTGNTIVDAVYQNREIAHRKSIILQRLAIEDQKYLVCTVHREESVDLKEQLESIWAGLTAVAEETGLPIIFPAHPRTQLRFKLFGMENEVQRSTRVRVMDSVGYLDMLVFLAHARMSLTDSGSIQEESCILRVPCILVRHDTERPESIWVGAAIMGGTNQNTLVPAALSMLRSDRQWPNPFDDGHAGRQIVDVAENALAERNVPPRPLKSERYTVRQG